MRKERPILALLVAAMVAPCVWMVVALLPEISNPNEIGLLLLFPIIAIALGMCGSFFFWSMSVVCLEGLAKRVAGSRTIRGMVLGLIAAYAHTGSGLALAYLDQSDGCVAAYLGTWIINPDVNGLFPWIIIWPPIGAGVLSGLAYSRLRG